MQALQEGVGPLGVHARHEHANGLGALRCKWVDWAVRMCGGCLGIVVESTDRAGGG